MAQKQIMLQADGALMSRTVAEETFVEAVGNEVIDTTEASAPAAPRRGGRPRRQNVLYNHPWWHDHGDELDEE